MTADQARVPAPYWLVAELTYQCGLQCAFCPNSVDFARIRSELTTADWIRVMQQARRMGVVQLTFTGGEPLLRSDLEELVSYAKSLGFYTSLETSGNDLDESRLRRLKRAGLGGVQLSFQDSTKVMNDFLTDSRTFELKRRAADMLRAHRFPVVIRCVLHRQNIEHLRKFVALGIEMRAELLDFVGPSNAGWAALNRSHLQPLPEQVAGAERIIADYQLRIGKRVQINYVPHRSGRCGALSMVVTPDGHVLPCRSARFEAGSQWPSLRHENLQAIWRSRREEGCGRCAVVEQPRLSDAQGGDTQARPLRLRTVLNSMFLAAP